MLKNKFGKIAIAIVLLSIVFLLGFKSENYFEISKNLDIFSSLYKEVNTYYVDDVNPSKFMRKGIDAMLESLDPYTNYISEDEIEGYRFQTTGKYGGIGATVRKAGDYVVIAEPYEKFAADKAGLQAGDMILEVDGKSVKGKSTDDISKILKGQPGTEVKLTIKKYKETSSKVVVVKREEIKVKSVPYSGMLNNGIAYVRLTQFTDQCGKEVENALKELKSKNEVKGIVLDLRGNPGGLLNEAVNLSNVFVDKGKKIVSTKGKVDEWDKDYLALNAPFDLSLPLVVLVNSGSASASEIVSGAIQDLDRGVIMGQKTFGKGLVQTTRGLSYGTQVKVTTAHYYTPSGRCIQALDYAHRNEDGSVGKIPDSLKKSFKTSIGRIVYDGGGVDPDYKLDAEKPSSITQSLFEKNLIFDFACEYFLKHDKIDVASAFKLTDNDYEDFLTYIRSKDFDYVTKSEEALKNFETTAEKEEYYAALKTDLIALKDKMAHDKEKDLNKHKDEIVKFLTQEIVSRYYYQTGRVVSSLYNDNEVNKAVELLSNIEEYNKLLKL
jgi:carboxyl-terminal processing protease